MEVLKGKVGVVRAARESDIEPIAANMRECDVVELRDGVMQTPLEALQSSFALSVKSFTITIGDDPVAMAGVGPLGSDPAFGVIWFLATDRMDKECRRDLRVLSPFFVDVLSAGYEVVGNLVDCRNTMSIKWLRKMGFVRIKDVVNTENGLPFALMVRRIVNV